MSLGLAEVFVAVFAICLTLGIWSYMRKSYRNVTHQTLQSSSTDYRACDSPNCARCIKYNQLRKDAYARLDNLELSYEIEHIERIKNALDPAQQLPSKQKPNVLYVDFVSQPLWDRDAFSKHGTFLDDINRIKRSYNDILCEFEEVFRQSEGWTQNRSERGTWYTYYIVNQGLTIQDNAVRCPVIVDLINSQLANCMRDCIFGNVFMSVMEPGTAIEPHYGPCNTRLRCHLGLRCTSEWTLTVDGTEAHWKNGRCLVFDDSFLHHVSHSRLTSLTSEHCEEPRAVLILDIWHPALTRIERQLLSELFPATVA